MVTPDSHQPSSAIATDQYNHKETIWRVILDVVSLTILIIVTVVSHYIATPFTRGYFCSDTSIKYPYKTDTIPAYGAVLLSIGVPIVWMWTTEFCKRYYFVRYQKPLFITRLELCGTRIATISPFIRNLYMLTVIFAYGYLATWVLLEVAKNFIGELRPHFLAVCQPNIDCASFTAIDDYNAYLLTDTNFTCTNTDVAAVREARRSFFSGHTAPLFYGFGWLIMYIHVSWSWRYLGIIGHLFQVGLAILACYVGYTRISDYHHHPHDVLTGAVVGSLIAFVTFKFILNWRHYDPRFLPYTASATHPRSSVIQNGGLPISNNRRINPKNGDDQTANF